MSAVAGGLALAGVSAVASSSSHAMLKAGGDKFAMQAWTQIIGLVVMLPFAYWVGLPERGIWFWLFAGWVLHTIYYLVLIWSYSASDYSAAYPIARGVIPIATALLGIAFLGDKLGPLALTGVAIISVGILLLSLKSGVSRSGLIAAGCAGLINTCFTLVDAKGMRVAHEATNFIVWYYIVDGIAMPLLFAFRAKSKMLEIATAHARPGLAYGLFALFAFFPTLIAFRIAPVGAVSSIRATSVILSLFIGGGLLKEKLSARKIGGALFVTIGAIAVIGGSALP